MQLTSDNFEFSKMFYYTENDFDATGKNVFKFDFNFCIMPKTFRFARCAAIFGSFITTFTNLMLCLNSKLVWNSLLKGFTFAFGLCVIYFAFAAVFRLGSDLVLSQELRFDNVFK